jgi:hypothetical protein
VSIRFRLELDHECYTPGDTIRGNVLVLEGGDSRSLEVLLEYNEEAEDGYSAIAASVSTGPLHAGNLATGMSVDFEVALPEDAFPNYRSDHGELYWHLDVKSADPGGDTHERHRVEVEPVHRTPPASATSAGSGPLPRGAPDPLEAGRNRYNSATWRRIYDSFVWRWVVGPIAFGAAVAALVIFTGGTSTAGGLALGACMTLAVVTQHTLYKRRRQRTDSG